MTAAWPRLDRELAAWGAAGRRATLWLRDDDACRDSTELQRLLDIACSCDAPVALAVIPAGLEPSLVAAVARCDRASVLQHGYAHRNHAPAGARSCELGGHRSVAATLAELVVGFDGLEGAFGERFLPVLVPPWNRIDSDVTARLPGAGFRALSTFGPRAAPQAAAGLAQCNTHVDLIAWRRDRAFIGAEAAIDRIVGHLQARRGGGVDPAEPTGLLTHHLALDDAAWSFLADFVIRTRAHDAVAWLDAGAIFGARGPRGAAISARSA